MSPAVWERLDLAIEAFEEADNQAIDALAALRLQTTVGDARHFHGEEERARIRRELAAQALFVAAKHALDDHDKDQLAKDSQ